MAIPVWKDVKGYEGLYIVSDTGQVKSLFRYKKVLKPNVTKRGYCTVQLFKDGKSKRLLIHRLVAEAFIPNEYNYPQVNHIDENKTNNSVANLEWCTAKYNMNYNNGIERRIANRDYSLESLKETARRNGKKVSRPVLQIDGDRIIARFESAKAASLATGIDHSHICDAARGKYKTAGGYKWKYERSVA